MSRRRSTRGEAGKRVARTVERLLLEPAPAPAGPVFDLEARPDPLPRASAALADAIAEAGAQIARHALGYPVEPMDDPGPRQGDAMPPECARTRQEAGRGPAGRVDGVEGADGPVRPSRRECGRPLCGAPHGCQRRGCACLGSAE